jgi:RNA polymerase sigma-70 factor (ECF subfamily)
MTSETRAILASESGGDIRKATDDLLTLAAKSGDGSAFVELSRRHSKRIHLHVFRILGNWEDAEDVVQDSLLRAFRHLDQLRKRRARPAISYDSTADSNGAVESWEFPDLTPSPERLCVSQETEVLLRRAILRLPWCYQTVAEMYHAKEYSTNEIAQDLGISVAAVKSRLYRARRTLRASLPKIGLSV